jgi:Fic family protein
LNIKWDNILTQKIREQLSAIDEFESNFVHVSGNVLPDILRQLKHETGVASVGASTRIEGSQMTDEEVEDFLANVSKQSFLSRDEAEVYGYSEVLQLLLDNHSAMPFSENVICQLHGMLLGQTVKDQRHRGRYKKVPNHVVATGPSGNIIGMIFETSSPLQTPQHMHELVKWTDCMLRESPVHNLLVTAIFTVVFLKIHPFQDGNGRLSRLMWTWLMLRSGYSYVPYSSLETIMENNKQDFYSSLYKTQRTFDSAVVDHAPWIKFFIECVMQQQVRLDKKIVSLQTPPQ